MSAQDERAFLRFLIVGVAGFITDAGLLFVLTLAGGDPFLMRILSFAAAIAVTWLGNRYWTFAERCNDEAGASFWAYLGVQSFGMGVNYAVFAALLWIITPTPFNAVLAAVIGSIVALAVNFTGASKLVFPEDQASRDTPAR